LLGGATEEFPGATPEEDEDSPYRLVRRRIMLDSHRTSLRLEPLLWDTLEAIAEREDITLDELCTRVRNADRAAGLTSAIRVMLVSYFCGGSPEAPVGLGELLERTFAAPQR